VLWTGRELLVWGGESGPDGAVLHSDGAAYNPATDTWRPLPAGPLSARTGQAAVWTGSEMIVWGGYDNVSDGAAHVVADGAAYNPATNTWRALPPAPLSGRAYAQSLWTGSAVMILGGRPAVTTAGSGQDPGGALYDPATDQWTRIAGPAPHDGHQVNWVATVATGGRVLAWSEWSEVHQIAPNESSGSGGVDLYRYRLATKTWQYVPADPQSLPDVEDVLWTGRDVYARGVPINCGTCARPFVPEATAVYDPTTDTWTRLPADPLGGDHLLSVWSGAALFSMNASGIYGSVSPGDASVYEPSTNTWSRTPAAPFACDSPSDPAWSGHQVLVYCPRAATGPGATHDGLAYTPGPT
jgi:hypothetical protein